MFLVIVIHVVPFGGGENAPVNYILQKIIARIAVPFFFTASGFLLFHKMPKDGIDSGRVKKYLWTVLRLYLIWTAIYSPFIIHSVLNQEKGVLVGTLIAARNFFLKGSFTHLWYLNALLFAVLLVWLFSKMGLKIKSILVISFVFFLIGLLGQSYFGLIYPLHEYKGLWKLLKMVKAVIGTTRNGLFEGFFFVTLGAFFARCKDEMKEHFRFVLVPIAGLLALLCEGLLIANYGHPLEWNTYLCSALAVFCLFWYACNSKKNWGISEKAGNFLRDLSGIVFFIHLWIRTLVDFLLARFASAYKDSFLRFALVCIISLILGTLITVLSKTRAFRFLRILF